MVELAEKKSSKLSQIKEIVEAAIVKEKFVIMWDKTGNASTYFQHMEKMNNFGKNICQNNCHGGIDDASAAKFVNKRDLGMILGMKTITGVVLNVLKAIMILFGFAIKKDFNVMMKEFIKSKPDEAKFKAFDRANIT